MSEPEIKFVVDECGRIVYRVTNEGVLLSKDEKEFIASHILHLQAENAKLRAYAQQLYKCIKLRGGRCQLCPHYSGMMCDLLTPDKLELLGIEVPDGS